MQSDGKTQPLILFDWAIPEQTSVQGSAVDVHEDCIINQRCIVPNLYFTN